LPHESVAWYVRWMTKLLAQSQRRLVIVRDDPAPPGQLPVASTAAMIGRRLPSTFDRHIGRNAGDNGATLLVTSSSVVQLFEQPAALPVFNIRVKLARRQSPVDSNRLELRAAEIRAVSSQRPGVSGHSCRSRKLCARSRTKPNSGRRLSSLAAARQ